MPTPAEITTHHDPAPDGTPWVVDEIIEQVTLVDYQSEWPIIFEELAHDIRSALGERALSIEHVGSTSVPGLAAKPVIDIDLTVADPRVEADYVPALEAIDYVLTIREEWWFEHRMLRLADPRVNLHVFGPDCPELIRHRLFRDRLRSDADDRDAYVAAKRGAAPGAASVLDYNQRKQPVIREIYERAFRDAGLL